VLGGRGEGARKGEQGGFGQESAKENLDDTLIKRRWRRWLGPCHPDPSSPRIWKPSFKVKQEDNSMCVTASWKGSWGQRLSLIHPAEVVTVVVKTTVNGWQHVKERRPNVCVSA
jgi:hypothetical protein